MNLTLEEKVIDFLTLFDFDKWASKDMQGINNPRKLIQSKSFSDKLFQDREVLSIIFGQVPYYQDYFGQNYSLTSNEIRNMIKKRFKNYNVKK